MVTIEEPNVPVLVDVHMSPASNDLTRGADWSIRTDSGNTFMYLDVRPIYINKAVYLAYRSMPKKSREASCITHDM